MAHGSRHAALLEEAVRHGIKPGLERIATLTRDIDVPPVIHVAGTNGKGSTVVMAEAILLEHGLSTGAYIKPHLIDVTERIRLDGREIAPGRFDSLMDELEPVIERMRDPPTYFEVLTALAVLAFSDARVDAAILETGMGGRLDATNQFDKSVACITRVALDHTDVLGATAAEIAREKAGILRPGVASVTGARGDALAAIEEVARGIGAPLDVLGRDILVDGDEDGFSVSYRGDARDLRTRLQGAHQIDNAALAVACASIFAPPLDPVLIRRALENATLPGRFQVVAHMGRTVVLDCAHNPDAAEVLAVTLASKGISPDAMVYAAMADKDIIGVLRALPRTRTFLTTVGEPRSAGREVLTGAADAAGLRASWADDPMEAMASALEGVPEGGTVLVTGSVYLVGRVLCRLAG